MTTLSKTKLSIGTLFAFYLLIAFEFFYMASPFAAFFYSTYKPALSFLDNFPSIAWTTGFFLPHLVEDTKSLFINLIPTIGTILLSSGLLFFLIGAFQIYYSKLFRKKEVTGGLYQFIRHPQYTAFAICSLGMLLLWPRYLSLIMFVTMLFGYYALAMIEEKECERKYGEGYLKYKRETGMFLPKRFKSKKNKLLSLSPIIKTTLISALYIATLSISLLVASQLKSKSINNLYTINNNGTKYISVFKKSQNELNSLIQIANSDSTAKRILSESEHENFIGYVLPADMYISEIPMQAPEILTSHVHRSTYNHQELKIVYTKAVQGSLPEENNDLNKTLSLNPVFEVWIDTQTKQITKRIRLQGTQRYSNISQPIF